MTIVVLLCVQVAPARFHNGPCVAMDGLRWPQENFQMAPRLLTAPTTMIIAPLAPPDTPKIIQGRLQHGSTMARDGATIVPEIFPAATIMIVVPCYPQIGPRIISR